MLLSDLEIPVGNEILLRLRGAFDGKTGKSTDLTYASIDCQGLKQIGVSAEVELSDQLCLPINTKGEIIQGQKVIGSFQTEIENWNDILAEVNFPSFEIKGIDGFVWNLQNAVFDFSDLKNSQNMKFPEGYDECLIAGNETLWRGVYVKDLSVTLPPTFKEEDGERVSFYAHDMLIDDNGISGLFGGKNILSFEKGNAEGWAFSVDELAIALKKNQLEGILFAGEIGLPISKKDRLGYTGEIFADNRYLMRVNTLDTLSFDLLMAKAELDPNSYIEFKVDNNKFRPEAMLHGRMGMEVTLAQNNDSTKSNTPAKNITQKTLKTSSKKVAVSGKLIMIR